MPTTTDPASTILAGAGVTNDPALKDLEHLRLLSGKEAAAFLGCSPNALAVMRSRGRGPAHVRLPGVRAIRYRVSDLVAYCRAGRRTCTRPEEG